MRSHALLLTLLLTVTATAQNPIGYPHDTVRSGSGNLVPFGFSSSLNFDEGTWQQLIPATALPTTAGLVTGIAVTCQSSNALMTYSSLVITLSNSSATVLGTSASANLPSPQVVFTGTNHSIQWGINRWIQINFTTPFIHNGVEGIVVSIQKVYDRVTHPLTGIVTHQTTGSPHRTDLVPVRYAFSTFGGGGATTDTLTTSSSAVLSMRMLFTNQGTMSIASMSQPSSVEFQIGTNASVNIWAADNTGYATLVNLGFSTPITVPFIQGRLLILPLYTIASGTTTGGVSTLTLPLPNDPTLADTHWIFQSATLNPSQTTLAWTNAADFFIRQ